MRGDSAQTGRRIERRPAFVIRFPTGSKRGHGNQPVAPQRVLEQRSISRLENVQWLHHVWKQHEIRQGKQANRPREILERKSEVFKRFHGFSSLFLGRQHLFRIDRPAEPPADPDTPSRRSPSANICHWDARQRIFFNTPLGRALTRFDTGGGTDFASHGGVGTSPASAPLQDYRRAIGQRPVFRVFVVPALAGFLALVPPAKAGTTNTHPVYCDSKLLHGVRF